MIRKFKMLRLLRQGLLATVLTVSAGLWSACSDDVDESAMYSFTGKTIASFLKDDGRFDKFYYLLTRVSFSDKSSSNIADLMTARGNYTCFVPTDEALQHYLDSVYHTTAFDITQVSDSTAEAIARDCIIDNKDNLPYRSTDFAEGTLGTPCMNDRFISIGYSADSLKSDIFVNKKSRIVAKDLEMENGVVHVVDHVLSFSMSTLPSLIESVPNLRVFSHLLRETGWADKLHEFRDLDYEMNHPEKGYDHHYSALIDCPAHRDQGFTAFVEPDDIYADKWGVRLLTDANGDVTNWGEVMAKADEMCRRYYPEARSSDLQSEDNAVNRFVSYHLVPRAVTYNKMVIHYNEIGARYNQPELLSISVPEYYETMSGDRRLLKVTEGATTQGKRLNRYVAKYAPADYRELDVPRPGIRILPTNGDYEQNALNGWYYPIDDILWYDSDVPGKVLNERMRYDASTLIPELVTAGLRRPSSDGDINIPANFSTSLYASAESNVVYLSGYGHAWYDYQGDEILVVGQYDCSFKLPAVPYAGTYEIRLGYTASSSGNRGMAQTYFGTDRLNLPAVGLPVDFRREPKDVSIGWREDDSEDEQETVAIDKTLRLHGYMKGPNFYGVGSSTGVRTPIRVQQQATRKIIYTGHMTPGQTYWMRFKSVLEHDMAELVLDYLEIVPKSVYNGAEGEDRW